MKINYIFLWLFIIFLFSCSDGKISSSDLKELEAAAIEKGDVESYNKVMLYYGDNNDLKSIIGLSTIMAYKYSCSDAHYVLYRAMIRIHNNNKFEENLIKNLNPDGRKFALDNLIRSSDLGNFNAKGSLIKYYSEGIYLPKNLMKVKELEVEME